MPIASLQRRGRQIGEIRIGAQVQTRSGKMAPAKLDAFRFTTKSAVIAQAVADLFGGTANDTTLLNKDQTHEVVTNVASLPVMVPPGDNVISQWMELYTKGGCQRRCDGETEQLTQSPCKCPFDQDERSELAKSGAACKPTTRLNVMLPDLPDLGVWLITSHGWNAAEELGGTANVLAAAREAGVTIPATLRLEQRQKIKEGKTLKFAVPVLEVGHTLRQMTALGAGDISTALPPPPPQAIAAIASTSSAPTIDMKLWIRSVLDEQQQRALSEQWKQTFDFVSTAVPHPKEPAVRALVNSFLNTPDDEPLLAEIVDDYSESNPQRSGGAVAQNLDPERPF